MPVSAQDEAYHKAQCIHATKLYVAGLDPYQSAQDWQDANIKAGMRIAEVLTTTNKLRDVAGALAQSSSDLFILRALFAPPISQDQLGLLCPQYSKAREKSGAGLSAASAHAVAAVFNIWRDKRLTPWLDAGSDPTARELENLTTHLAPLMSDQFVKTAQRTRLSAAQENAIISLLLSKQWTQDARRPLITPADLPPKHFMHKALCRTTALSPGEVDIALGVSKGLILAMECKVTNDPTNSVKRTDDVLKKHSAWKPAWGTLIETAAVMQGAIKYKSIEKLLERGVHVFWSHDLAPFEAWIQARLQV
jgi:hypothetical protein